MCSKTLKSTSYEGELPTKGDRSVFTFAFAQTSAGPLTPSRAARHSNRSRAASIQQLLTTARHRALALRNELGVYPCSQTINRG